MTETIEITDELLGQWEIDYLADRLQTTFFINAFGTLVREYLVSNYEQIKSVSDSIGEVVIVGDESQKELFLSAGIKNEDLDLARSAVILCRFASRARMENQ